MIDRLDRTPTIYVMVANTRRSPQVHAMLEGTDCVDVQCVVSTQQLTQRYRPDDPGCLLVDHSVSNVGRGFFDALTAHSIDLPVIVLASNPSISECAAAMRLGAFDFVDMSSPKGRLLESIRAAIGHNAQQHQWRIRRGEVLARMQQLTQRQRETLELVLEGLSTTQIAAQFGVRFQTAAKHHARLLRKMAVRNDAELVRLCMTNDMPAGNRQSNGPRIVR
jgi:FixJ family two-component response regulator